MFFVGLHIPHKAHRVPRAFISTHILRRRKSAFQARNWIMDSGAFTTIMRHGGYPEAPASYAAEIRRWSNNSTLLAAVSQDYMCEPHMLARTGLSVEDHQRLTIERYDALMSEDLAGIYLMPVLQGYAPEQYVDHIRQYGARLKIGAWTGVGSVCKRNASPESVTAVLAAIKSERPDLRLHGFGVKTTALSWDAVRDRLYSADSMAWSFAARMEGRDPNSIDEAIRFARKIDTQRVQTTMFGNFG